MKGVDDLKKRIISIFFGLIPFIQFFLGGWIFFGVSLILMILSYFIIRKNSSLNFVVYALVLIASQTAVFMNGVSNIPLFVYMAIASALFLVAASDEKVIDNFRKELNQAGVKTKEGVFELCFFGMGEINDLESLSGLKTTFRRQYLYTVHMFQLPAYEVSSAFWQVETFHLSWYSISGFAFWQAGTFHNQLYHQAL